jgi:hypothetical protein
MAQFMQQANAKLDAAGFEIKAVFVTFNTQGQADACRAACAHRECLQQLAAGLCHWWMGLLGLPGWNQTEGARSHAPGNARLAEQLVQAEAGALPRQVPLLGGGSKATRGLHVRVDAVSQAAAAQA